MNVYIFGTGVMGSAIAARLAGSKKYRIIAANRNEGKLRDLARRIKLQIDREGGLVHQADVIVIAVKPQDVPAVAGAIRGKIPKKAVVVSIAAGLNITRLQKLFGHSYIVRVMPNLGITVGQGIAGWVAGRSVTPAQRAEVKIFLKGMTEAIEFKNETTLDKVTIISGCGPAYFYYVAEAMVQAGLRLGLAEKDARQLVRKTLATAAAVDDKGLYPTLIARVASKKGVTEAALKVFSKKKMNKIVDAAVDAALKRTKELSHG